MTTTMIDNDRVLVAIMTSKSDLDLAREHCWYRIPVRSAKKWVGSRWPPQWLAFYQTGRFGREAFSITYYSQVQGIKEVSRRELFPHEAANEKSEQLYYQLLLGPLCRRADPIMSRRRRRITFICTTWRKFVNASEVNDLFNDSLLENRLWAEFRRIGISAERQMFVQAKSRNYALDFAIYCGSGKLDVETDGDRWHSDPKSIAHDNIRSNDLQTCGWRLLRFNGMQVEEQMAEYCLPTILENIAELGGLDADEGRK